MDNDWDLELSHQIDSHQTLENNNQVQPDLMLQPITTQEKFNVKSKNKQQNSKASPEHYSSKQIHSVQQGIKKQKSLKDSQELAEQARKFRQYLTQKVEELKRSKEQTSNHQKESPQQKSKVSNLRKIIKKEELQSKQSIKQKTKSSAQNAGFQNQTNLINKTAVQIQKVNQSSAFSVGKYRKDKKFSNSQSSLAKNAQKKESINSKNTTVTDIKKSLNSDPNSKIPKLPELTPKLKIPFPTKNQSASTQKNIETKKKVIDSVLRKDQIEIEKERRTPESKNSFRIKRTSNASNIQTKAQPNQQKISLDIKRPNESFKTTEKEIQKQKERKNEPSPLHQGKNKKMREDFMKFNQQEKKIQDEILKHHQITKQNLDKTMQKYELSSNAYQKYNIKKQTEFLNQPQVVVLSPTKIQAKQSRINPQKQKNQQEQAQKQSVFKRQERKNRFLDEQLQKINNLLKAREHNINKNESKVQKNPLMQFIRSMPEDIFQEIQDDENDKVEALPAQSGVTQDRKYDPKEFSSTYSSVMTEIKSKKWGLKQRITFETHRDQNEILMGHKKSSQVSQTEISTSNKKLQENSRLPEPPNHQQNETYAKIQVNSRLKNFLLD